MRAIHLFLVFIMSCSGLLHAQTIQVKGTFLQDSVAIGEPVVYALSARYPSDKSILFPDSTFSFSPFEFSKKIFFQTSTASGISADSTVYYLTTFEVDSIQYLSLPVFVVQAKDCLIVRPANDSLILKQLVTEMPPDTVSAQNLPLRVDVKHNPLDYLFNYPVLAGVIMGLLLLALIIWLVFGKRIRKHFLVKRLTRRYQQFSNDFAKHISILRHQFSTTEAETALALWKRYLEELEAKPYTKITTREALSLLHNDRLVTSLRQIDAAIYGHNTQVIEPFKDLEQYAAEKFTGKLQTLKNG
jgi:hypothetical protein